MRDLLSDINYCLLAVFVWYHVDHIQGGQKTGTLCFVHINFVKYWPIFKLTSLSESGKHL